MRRNRIIPLDYFLSQSIECRIHFLWRPHLPDPKDDSVLELALAGSAPLIETAAPISRVRTVSEA
jgi:hypothetical protein